MAPHSRVTRTPAFWSRQGCTIKDTYVLSSVHLAFDEDQVFYRSDIQ